MRAKILAGAATGAKPNQRERPEIAEGGHEPGGERHLADGVLQTVAAGSDLRQS
jgi:hypothetical protein